MKRVPLNLVTLAVITATVVGVTGLITLLIWQIEPRQPDRREHGQVEAPDQPFMVLKGRAGDKLYVYRLDTPDGVLYVSHDGYYRATAMSFAPPKKE